METISRYQSIILDLRKILMTYGIKCHRININSQSKHIADMEKKAKANKWREKTIVKVSTLIKNKYKELNDELDRVNHSMNIKMNNLNLLNELLINLEKPKQLSITKAKKELKSTYINIFDLEAGIYHKKFADKKEFKKYTIKNKLFYPLEYAKSNLQFKCILQNI